MQLTINMRIKQQDNEQQNFGQLYVSLLRI